METCEGAPQDPRPRSPHDADEDMADTDTAHAESPPSRPYSTTEGAIGTTSVDAPRARHTSTKKSASGHRKKSAPHVDADAATPRSATSLCICPTCDKVLASMKSLYGHHGRAHKAAVRQGNIKYACPFCDDAPELRIFETTAALAAHIAGSHPGCRLLLSLTETSSKASATAAAAANRARDAADRQGRPSAPAPAAAARRRSDRQKAAPEGSAPPAPQFQHPLCKCPVCPRILPPQGIFGHFGRVHSGQLTGHSAKFRWEDVAYACPFCPATATEGGAAAGPEIYRTLELIEAHVRQDHANCQLTRPNALLRSSEGSQRASLSPEPDAVCSYAGEPTRKSRRSRRSAGGEGHLDAGDADTSTVATRKSQRSMAAGEGHGKRPAATPQNVADGGDVADVAKQLYNCPDCDKRNLTKHGLHAHYGMVHGGRVDMGRVTLTSRRRKKALSRLGPWTEEEHGAFLDGHGRLGNRWKQISVEYVPTRDAKQIGSHALNYFTTRGEWKDVASFRPDLVDSAEQRGHWSNHRRSGRASDPTEVDEGKEEEEETKEGTWTETISDDGNSSHCILCFEGGNIVCCSKCPRAYHPKCLAKDGHGNLNVELLPNDWRCHRCRKDSEISAGVGEEISQKYAFGSKKIRAAYAEFRDCADYNKCCALLSNILDVVAKLKTYDYGYIFSEPVDVEDVPDYVEVIDTPMDYGTISERLEGGNYVDLISADDISRDDENSTMEEILLHVLTDIERVSFNCQLYNKEGSSIYRIGGVHANKWKAYLSQYILDILPDNVERDLTLFQHRCRLELQKGSHSKRVDRAEKSTETSTRTLLKASSISSAPSKSPFSTAHYKKRKAPESPLEKHGEQEEDKEEGNEASEEEGKEENKEEEEEEEQQKPKAKKAKQEGNTAILFTGEQIQSLENVFFSSVTKLREEFDELDACSALEKLAFNPSASTDDKTHNPSAIGSHVLSCPALSTVKSELSIAELHHTSSKDDSNPPLVPALHGSGYTTVEPPPALPMTATCSTPASLGIDTVDTNKISTVVQNPNGTNADRVPNTNGAPKEGGSVYQRQWYERLNELKKYKLKNGRAVVSATSNDKLYHWRLRQRKRYHLTLLRMPHLKNEFRVWDSEGGEDKHDKQWLLAVPEMKGVFALSEEGNGTEKAPAPFTIEEKDVKLDENTADAIHKKHTEQLYCPPSPVELLPLQHSSRHTNSLFWDECLEELRFFRGEHQHTLVPRDFPHNSHLPVWVEIQRARYLLQSMGLFSGLMGWQMLVLEELDVCNLSNLPYDDGILATSASGSSAPKSPQKGSGTKKRGITKPKEGSTSQEKKTWSALASDFQQWFQKLGDKPKASEILPRANWPLYSWCWRQCNASSAVLCMTPNVGGITMSVTKLSTLASVQFFHAFNYNNRNGVVREDDYEGSAAFDSTFQILEDFSIKYGSTRIPDWYECDPAFLMWITALERGLSDFVKGEPCILSVHQIERLILIGFFNDRDAFPNLSKGDVVWLKMLLELKRHRALLGVDVSKDFPHLHKWIAEHKKLFRLSRTGKRDMMKSSRLKMLMEAGVDFFTGDCLPNTDNLNQRELQKFELLTSSPTECFPVKDNATNNETNYGSNVAYDSHWINQDCQAKFEQLKVMTGSSLILATDDEDVYWWFVEKRGKTLISELNSVSGSIGQCSLSILSHITTQRQGDNTRSDGDVIEAGHSMFLWLHYCERLMMFKAREGHCKLPKDYPDVPLRQWLTRQQELIHLHSTNEPTELLSAQMKILHALGIHGKKRNSTPPKQSSRMLKRKTPSRKDKKSHDSDKSRNQCI